MMKKIVKKNQIMITALAIMIAVAGYLNFSGAKKGKEDIYAMSTEEVGDLEDYEFAWTDEGEYVENLLDEDMDIESLEESSDLEVPGEAIFTSTSAVNSLAGAKLLKEQTRAKNKETLMEIINNENLSEDAKVDAVNSMIALTDHAQRETEAEMLLEAKGYTESVVSISDNTADVFIRTSQLTDTQTAQIMDIVQRKTDISPENIIITVSNAD